jgi:MutS-like protein
MTDPRAEYENRIARWSAAVAAGERTHLLISNLRLAAAAAGALLAWLALGRGAISLGWAIAAGLALLVLVVVHARVLNRNDRAARARRFYEHGVSRIEDRWAGIGSSGAGFVPALHDHLYAADLDLFGDGSLFQLLSTARTESGEERLAAWLTTPAEIEEATRRQTAIRELRDRVEFREAIAVLAAEARVSKTSALTAWAALPPVGFSGQHAWLFAALAAITALMVAAGFTEYLDAPPVVVWIAIQAAVASLFRRRVHEVLRRVDAATYDLGLLRELLARIERERFSAPRLVELEARICTDGEPPSRVIARLHRYIAARDSLRNELARPFALLLLVRSQAAVAIDRWHAAHRATLGEWLTAVGEIEAFSSFATYAFEHPADPFPELRAGAPLFEADALAHPLLPARTAVPNDVRLGGGGPHVLVVSGSNMSGKSTLLRAIGINAVMALAGAPVRAARLSISPLAIGATIRIGDSLQEGHSRFYTEILRIRDIVARARGASPVLFLLDEILHGTNSHDRRIGAEAIVRSLVAAGAIGSITTHDLALTGLAATLGAQAANVHFEDRIEEGKMVFDYKMRPGVVERSNAIALMRAVGLDV